MNEYIKIVRAEKEIISDNKNKFRNKDLIMNLLFKKENKLIWIK